MHIVLTKQTGLTAETNWTFFSFAKDKDSAKTWMAFRQSYMLVRYQEWKIWQSHPDPFTCPSIYGEDLLFVLVKFTLDLLLLDVHLQRHWPITPNSASLVLSPLELDSNFDLWWEPVWIDYWQHLFILTGQQEHFVSAFLLLHQIWEWLHWSRVFKGPRWPVFPQEHGLTLGQHYAAVWGDSAQDGGQRNPTDQEQRPPTKTLL